MHKPLPFGMYKPLLLGICGSIGGGKTLTVEILRNAAQKHSFVFKHASQAQPIKDIVQRLFPMPTNKELNEHRELRDEPLLKLKPNNDLRPDRLWTPRTLWQYIGTDVIRKIYPDAWVDLLIWEHLTQVYESKTIIACDDIRFPNELSKIKEQEQFEFKLIHVDRGPGYEQADFHESEKYGYWLWTKSDIRITAPDRPTLEAQIEEFLIPLIQKRKDQ